MRDYFVLKPKHAAFFATTLATLLKYLRVERLISTGIAGDTCVLITEAEAYLREFELKVPQGLCCVHLDGGQSPRLGLPGARIELTLPSQAGLT